MGVRDGGSTVADEHHPTELSLDPPRSDGSGPCDVCGAPTFERNCKVVCRTCGYVRDCSDP